MPPNKILGPAEAEEARAGAGDRNDLPVWHPAPSPPHPRTLCSAHHAVTYQMSQITLKYILEKYCYKLQVNVVFYVHLSHSSPPLLALCNM